MSARHALEHRLWRSVREQGAQNRRFLLACSGGADSVALVRAFAAILPADRLVVAHVHHGAEDSGYRDRAQDFVTTFARGLNLKTESRRHEGAPLRSEADLRRVRRAFLEEMRLSSGADVIVAAHHAGDLAETRVIRLLRGTGPAGLKAMRELSGVWYRPFLPVPAAELRAYLETLGQDHLEDPSNRDPRFLRNWLRHTWLPALEKRRPGAGVALARSLEDLAQALTKVESAAPEPVVARPRWEASTASEKLGLLAECLRGAGQPGFTRGQLEEIRKRLDNRRKVHTFVAAGCEWTVDVRQIRARLQE